MEHSNDSVIEFNERLVQALGWIYHPASCGAAHYWTVSTGGVVSEIPDFRKNENIHFLLTWLAAENKETNGTCIGVTWAAGQSQKGGCWAGIDPDGQFPYQETDGDTAAEALGWAILGYDSYKKEREAELASNEPE